jgi:hypothetical protein
LAGLEIGDHVTVQAQVKSFKNLKNAKGGSRQEVIISDGSGSLTLMFFNQHWREKDLAPGRQGLFAGQVSVFNNKRQLTHPDYELLTDASEVNPDDYAEAFLPVYPATKKLPTWTIERSIDLVLSGLGTVEDPLPIDIRSTNQLMELNQALRVIHKPGSLEELEASRLRLKWDEALALQVVLAKQRHEEDSWPAVPRNEKPDGLLAAFEARLPFTLTQGQIEVAKTTKKSAIEQLDAYKKLETEYKAYEYYLDSIKRDGVPYELIAKAMPKIEAEINNVLNQVVDFNMVLQSDGKNINGYIIYDEDNFWPLELTSGMERFISSLAIRIALINVSALPRPNFIAIDEGWGSLDAEHIASVVNLFDYFRTKFDFSIVISHVDTMRDMVDSLIEVNKINNFSQISHT